MEIAKKRLRLLMLADLGSPHTQRWAIALAERGLQVMVVGLNPVNAAWHQGVSGVKVEHLGIPRARTIQGEGTIIKLMCYLRTVPKLKRLLGSFHPDILHAHYATSYGFIASVSGFHPWICSLWGTDVYSFPRKSPQHRHFFRFVLSWADQVCSTSSAMAKEGRKYISRNIYVTPFGIDCEQFYPVEGESNHDAQSIIIGTIKSLEPNYRIDLLIRSVSRIHSRYPHLPLELLIVGGGSQRAELESLAVKEGLSEFTTFVGHVPHQRVPEFFRMLSVYVAASASESFGVAVLEASASGLPVVVSNVGGMPEVVRDGETGFIVPPDDLEATTVAIEKLVMNPMLRSRMGANGRQWVLDKYDWERSVDIMLDVYDSVGRRHEGMNMKSRPQRFAK